MSIAWHPKRWWNFCMFKDEKKEIWDVYNKIIQLESVERFCHLKSL